MEITNNNGFNLNTWPESALLFLREISSHDHVVQIYKDENTFLNNLERFAGDGIITGECVIVIATVAHLRILEERLKMVGFNPFELMLRNQYIPLEAEKILSTFMINGWPDELLFKHIITGLIARARRSKRHVRAFGEMVALLWAQGYKEATFQLEHLWNNVCETEGLSLFCAYPKIIFTEDANEWMKKICRNHSHTLHDAYFRT